VISVSRLLCGEPGPGDHLRYGETGYSQSTRDRSPIVVWNCTRRCNLRCAHCYSDSGAGAGQTEMNTNEGKALIRQLADFRVPVLLMSGGEPLLREDFLELSSFAAGLGVGVAASTNGTLVSRQIAGDMRTIGFREVGISLDGVGETNDRFRGVAGAFEAALSGIRACVSCGHRVSLRMTITRWNLGEVGPLLDLVEKENIDRVCFYHLAYSGRGGSMRKNDLTRSETRSVVDLICDRSLDFYRRGLRKEILMVGNHADGVYLYLKLKAQDPARAQEALSLLRRNGGNNSGILIAAVDETGGVHPDQFWRTVTLGNVLERPFSDIWTDTSNPLLGGLKDRKGLLKGRCAACKYVDLCNGNLRARAEAVYGDVWQEDPACYLTDEEIGLA
jgi:radical SAM protein with 4Fe4S-binding SPASM domain